MEIIRQNCDIEYPLELNWGRYANFVQGAKSIEVILSCQRKIELEYVMRGAIASRNCNPKIVEHVFFTKIRAVSHSSLIDSLDG